MQQAEKALNELKTVESQLKTRFCAPKSNVVDICKQLHNACELILKEKH